MNKVVLSGNLVKDAEIIPIKTGAVATKCRLATKSSYKNKNGEWVNGETIFINITHFNKNGLNLKKGDFVVVEGRLHQNRWEKDGKSYNVIEVIAYDLKRKTKNSTIAIPDPF